MKEKSYEQIDDLFAKIRLRILQLRQSDQASAEELKGLVIQLEDCVESLVIDSLKLRSLESTTKMATESVKKRIKRPSGKQKTH